MRKNLVVAGAALAASVALLVAQPAIASPAHGGPHPHPGPTSDPNACSASVDALSFSDALDKLQDYGATVGGLSSIAWDQRQQAWVSAVDNNGAGVPEYIWSYRNLNDPKVTHAPLVLKKPDGTPYDGGPAATDPNAADNEGLAVLNNGSYLVSSETEPSIRIYGRDGVQRASLPVPARFAVIGTTAAGEATSNATLEGLTITPDGNTIIAAMEGALSGDVSAAGDATSHRLLVYTQVRGSWRLSKQIEYKTDAGMRIPEVAAYSNDAVIVEEASFSTTAGNAVNLFAVTGLSRAADVSHVANLGNASPRLAVQKTRLADLVNCPTLGAPALETQANPLLDNFEGMAVTGRLPGGKYGVTLISDDNNSAQQHTRLLNLAVKLP
ncbi:esterase-like activity of phytase family protein [Gryllotalpicola protaetiae]|uniref:Esterase-like activity of phytase family protein n=1 Tax=Gryllotalpicola protaetiae TaxID=2419771 RepID=A0A387BP88_9MICO|nr:esterase-like activity of phytase family protein [Gryllotalpicola protaetiae]AYG02766.1 esterase-like activity of phytase family protein [Gryllotalpicola protaetiae]